MMESTVTCQFRSTAKSTSRIAKYQKSWQLADKRCGGWREKGQIPRGLRYRTRQVLFKREEVEAIRQFANHLEPIELGSRGSKQLGLFPRTTPKEQS
jgi:hypothetical protein